MPARVIGDLLGMDTAIPIAQPELALFIATDDWNAVRLALIGGDKHQTLALPMAQLHRDRKERAMTSGDKYRSAFKRKMNLRRGMDMLPRCRTMSGLLPCLLGPQFRLVSTLLGLVKPPFLIKALTLIMSRLRLLPLRRSHTLPLFLWHAVHPHAATRKKKTAEQPQQQQ